MGLKKIFNYIFPDDDETEKQKLKNQLISEFKEFLVGIDLRIRKLEKENDELINFKIKATNDFKEIMLYREDAIKIISKIENLEDSSNIRFNKIIKSLKKLNLRINEIKLKY